MVENLRGNLSNKHIRDADAYLSQIKRTELCPVRNCSIGKLIESEPQELREAISFGQLSIIRNASHDQRYYGGTGCECYSTEEVKIFYDKEGNVIDYELPYTDPEQILSFTLVAGLVNYGSNPSDTMVGISTNIDEGEWGEISRKFDDLMYAVLKMQRSIFPPDAIMVKGKPHEVFAVCACNNLTCVSNSGKIEIKPLPFKKE